MLLLLLTGGIQPGREGSTWHARWQRPQSDHSGCIGSADRFFAGLEDSYGLILFAIWARRHATSEILHLSRDTRRESIPRTLHLKSNAETTRPTRAHNTPRHPDRRRRPPAPFSFSSVKSCRRFAMTTLRLLTSARTTSAQFRFLTTFDFQAWFFPRFWRLELTSQKTAFISDSVSRTPRKVLEIFTHSILKRRIRYSILILKERYSGWKMVLFLIIKTLLQR